LALTVALFFPLGRPIAAARKRQEFGGWVILHLVASATISLVCLANILITPIAGKSAAKCHRAMGYFGLSASAVGLVSGLIAAWWERARPELAGLFAGWSVAAVLQATATIMGYLSIRRAKAEPDRYGHFVWRHKAWMIFLWASCLGPLFFRVPQYLGASSSSPLMFFGLIPSFGWPFVVLRAYEKHSFI